MILPKIFEQMEGKTSRKLAGTDAYSVITIRLEAGGRLAAHTSPTDACLVVMSGAVNFTLLGEPHHLEAGDAITFGAGEEHSVDALEASRLILIR